MSSLSVGLTGGLASGKSTLSTWLEESGCLVVEADRLVAELYRPGDPGARAVGELFGAEMLADDGSVDQSRLADLVFSDDVARRRLEEAIHPMVGTRFRHIAEQSDGIVVLEASQLFEAGMASDFDLIVTVEADAETRVKRAVRRGLAEKDARARIAAQGSDVISRGRADVVIENHGSLGDLRRQAGELIELLQERAQS